MFLILAGHPGFGFGGGAAGMIILVTKTINKGFQMIKMSDQMNHEAAVN